MANQSSLIKEHQMNKYVIGIDGMRCGMCEMHAEETISKKLHVKKAKASHLKNQVVVISSEDLTLDDFKSVLKKYISYKI